MRKLAAFVVIAFVVAWAGAKAADTIFPTNRQFFHVIAAVSVENGRLQRMLPEFIDVLLTGPLNIVSNSGPEAKIVTLGPPAKGESIWKVEPGGGLLFSINLPPGAQHQTFKLKVMVFDQQQQSHSFFVNVNGEHRYLDVTNPGVVKTVEMGQEWPDALKSGQNLIEVSNFDNPGAIGVQALVVDFDLPRHSIALRSGGQVTLISPAAGPILADQERGVFFEWEGKGVSEDSGVALYIRTHNDPISKWRLVPGGEALPYNNSDGRSKKGSWVWHPGKLGEQLDFKLRYLDPTELRKKLCKLRTPLHDLSKEVPIRQEKLKHRFTLLLSAGCRIEAKSGVKDSERTPLHEAVRSGNIGMVDLLLENNADVHAEGRHGALPIHYAKSLDIVKKLAKHGSNLKAAAANGVTPLLLSAWRGHLDIAEFLLETGGANANDSYKFGTTSLHWVARYCDRPDSVNFVETLLKYGASVDSRSNRDLDSNDILDDVILTLSPTSRTPLHETIIYCNENRENQLAMVEILTTNGANVNSLTKNGYSPLVLAIVNRSTDASIVRQLIERGADPNQKFFTCSLLWAAIRYSKNTNHDVPAKVRLLIEALPTIVNEPCSDQSRTAIYSAVSNGNIDTVEYLISKNAKVNFSQFSLLSLTKDPQMIQLLKRSGAK